MEQLVDQLELEGEISSQTNPSLIRQISQTGETGVLKIVDGRFERRLPGLLQKLCWDPLGKEGGTLPERFLGPPDGGSGVSSWEAIGRY